MLQPLALVLKRLKGTKISDQHTGLPSERLVFAGEKGDLIFSHLFSLVFISEYKSLNGFGFLAPPPNKALNPWY